MSAFLNKSLARSKFIKQIDAQVPLHIKMKIFFLILHILNTYIAPHLLGSDLRKLLVLSVM